MSFNAGSIAGTLGLDISDFTRGMLSAQGMMSVFPSFVTNFMASPLLGLIGIARDAGSALVGMLKGVTDAEDNLRDMARSLGVSVSWLDAMGKTAELDGSNLLEMADAIKFLNKNAYEAATAGGTANKSFALLGIKVKDAGGHIKNTQALTEEVIDKFAKLGDGAEKTAVAMDLFGRGGGKAIAFFSQGMGPIREYTAHLEAMGAIATKESAEQADAWNDLLTTVGHAWAGIKKQLVEPIRDALKPYLQGLVSWVSTHQGEIKRMVLDVVSVVLRGLDLLIGGLKALLDNLKAVIVAMGAIQGFRMGSTIGNLIAPGVGGLVGGLVGAGVGAAAAASIIKQPSNTFNINIDGSSGTDATLADLQSQVGKALRDQEQKAASDAGRKALGGL